MSLQDRHTQPTDMYAVVENRRALTDSWIRQSWWLTFLSVALLYAHLCSVSVVLWVSVKCMAGQCNMVLMFINWSCRALSVICPGSSHLLSIWPIFLNARVIVQLNLWWYFHSHCIIWHSSKIELSLPYCSCGKRLHYCTQDEVGSPNFITFGGFVVTQILKFSSDSDIL